jgi:ankyrin repeat protein
VKGRTSPIALSAALDWSGRSPLHWAAQFGRADVAEVLIRFRAEVGRPAADGATPLHWAAQEGHSEVIRLLLGHGARPDVPDGHGRVALTAVMVSFLAGETWVAGGR